MNLELIKKCGKVKNYKLNDFIVIEGDLGNTMYIIVKGKVGVYLNSFVDEPFIVAELGVGSFFGEMSILDNKPRSATIVSMEENTTVLEITKEHFNYLLEKDEDLSYRIIKTLADRVHNVKKQLPQKKLSTLDKYKKDELYKYIDEYSKEIFEFVLNQNPEKIVAMAQYASEVIRDLEQKLLEAEENQCDSLMKVLDVIPEGHKKYVYEIDNNYDDLLLERKMKCPVCGHEFISLQPKFRSAKIIKIEKDLRRFTKPYSAEWYNIVTCPECLYSEYGNEFNKLSSIYVDEAKKKLNKILPLKAQMNLKEININTIFIQYYLAMMCTFNPKNRDLKMAKSWLNLSWLYSDVEDNEMYEYSYLKAYEIYNDFYLNSASNLSDEDEQTMIMILAEFARRQGKIDEALKLLFEVTQIKNGNKQISSMARDSIMGIKESK